MSLIEQIRVLKHEFENEHNRPPKTLHLGHDTLRQFKSELPLGIMYHEHLFGMKILEVNIILHISVS